MAKLWNSALALLVVTGGLLGLTLPFGKIATDAGIPALLWSFLISIGVGGVLSGSLTASGRSIAMTGDRIRYFVVTAAVSYAIPNLLMFSAIPHLGAGYTGIMLTLSPVITLALSLIARVRQPNLLGVGGIAVGFAGAIMVTTTRGEFGRPAEVYWVLVGLLIPIFLASGNIYRSFDWPERSGPIELAAGSHLASAAILAVGLLVTGQIGSVTMLAKLPLVAVAQVASSSAMFAVFFRLQAVGGPVYLSQIGYVAAAVGLGSGALFLGEHYGPLTWAGAAVITTGVLMTTRAQRKTALP